MKNSRPSPWRACLGWVRLAAISAFCLFVAACDQQATLEKVTSAEDRALSVKMIRSVQSGDMNSVKAFIRPDLRSKWIDIFPQLRAEMPTEADSSVTLVDGGFTTWMPDAGQATRNSHLAYQVQHGTQYALVRIDIQRQGGTCVVTSFWINALDRPIGELTTFRLSNKKPIQYLVFALAVGAFAISIAALVLLGFSKGVRYRWLWAIGCLVGLGQVSVNWSNASLSFNPINVQLLSAFFVKSSMIGAWNVGFGIPVFSMAFLLLRPRLLCASKPKPNAQTDFG